MIFTVRCFIQIPLIQKAASLLKEELLLFGSPWSAPAWMKTNEAMNGKGSLKGEPGGKYYETWANYFVRYMFNTYITNLRNNLINIDKNNYRNQKTYKHT